MLALMGIILVLLATHTSFVRLAANGLEATSLDCISKLLTPEECQELYIHLAIAQKEEDQPPEEKDHFTSSQWQDPSNMAPCKETLNQWLEIQSGTVDWDRLARALRQIGRPDVSRELKKSLSRSRSLEPKWNMEKNQTVEASNTAALTENKATRWRIRHIPIQKHRKTPPQVEDWGLKTLFLKLFPLTVHNLSLQPYMVPITHLLIASFFTGLILWLVSVYYSICWNWLPASRIHNNARLGTQNMSLTMIWNFPAIADSLDDGEDDQSTSEHEDPSEEVNDPSSFY